MNHTEEIGQEAERYIDHPYGVEIFREHSQRLSFMQAFANGCHASGWQRAHDAAACGHPRACRLDPQWGTAEYAGNETCIACIAEAELTALREENARLKAARSSSPAQEESDHAGL